MKHLPSQDFFAPNPSSKRLILRQHNFLAMLYFALLTLSIYPMSLQAQTPPVHWTAMNGFQVGYQLSTPVQVLEPNQLFSVKFYLDVPLAFQCKGAKIDMNYSNGIVPSNVSEGYLLPSSWLGDGDDLVTQFEDGFQEGAWTLSRSDEMERSGNGHLLTVYFKVGEDSIDAGEVVQALSAGLIVVENMDMKGRDPERELAISFFPNPFLERIHLSGEGASNLIIRNLKGEVVKEMRVDDSQWVALERLLPGIYTVELWHKDGSLMLAQKMIKQ